MLQRDLNHNPASVDRAIIRSSSFPAEHVSTITQLCLARALKPAESLMTEALGVHGIGSITLFEALETGYLPTGRSPGNKDHLYLYPFSSANLNIPGLGLLCDTTTAEESDAAAIERAASYAYGNSELLYKARILKLDLATSEGWRIASQLNTFDNELHEIPDDVFQRAGTTRGDAERVASLFPGLNRGFLLFLGRSAKDKHTCSVGDDGEGDIKLHAPQGVSLKDCIAIQPLTPEDGELIRMLQPTR